MIAWASGLGMAVGSISRPLRGMRVLATPDAGLDTTCRIGFACEVPLGAGVFRLLVPGVAVGVIIDSRCAADGVISALRELFSEDEGVVFSPWIVEATEFPV